LHDCARFGIRTAESVATHPLMGNLFENFVVAEEMKQLLRSQKTGKITIFSTHILDLALDLCDEIVLLSHGMLEPVGKADLNSHEFREKIIQALRDEDKPQ
jgi:ABC-type multidrug transport system ATPase subunit